MDWPNLNTADSVGRVCGLVKDKRGRAYRLPAKIIGNVVHEVKQNKENQESAVFLNSRPLRLPFGCRMSDVRHDWEDFSMDSGTDPFAKCQLLLEIRFWWMRMQNSQTEPGVAARLEVNPSKAPMFCLRRLEIVSAYPAQKPSAVALANHFSEKHAWAHQGYWFSLYSSRYLARQRHSYRHPHASTCQILTTRRARFTSCDVTRILIRRQNLSPCRAANVAFRARKKDWNIIFKVAETVSMKRLCIELHI